jgi:hypothetical protein
LVLTDRFTQNGQIPRSVHFPAGSLIGANRDIWVAHQGAAFLQVFGFLPDYEAFDTLPEVPDVRAAAGWIRMPSTRGTVALMDDARWRAGEGRRVGSLDAGDLAAGP